MNEQQIGWIYQVKWNNPYTVPPNGRRVLAEMFILSDGHGAPRAPAELTARCMPGYSVHITAVKPPIQERPPEARAATRRKLLARRNAEKAPLFAEQFTAEDIARKPDYYLAGLSDQDAVRAAEISVMGEVYQRMLRLHGQLLIPEEVP